MLIREVDEAVRHDQAATLAQKYGVPAAIALVLGLAGFGGYLYWDHRQEAAMDTRSEEIVSALDELEAGNLDAADKELAALVDDGTPGAIATARLTRAGIAMEQGRTDEAVALYEEVAADGSAPQPMRDLATVRDVAAKFDSMSPDEVVTRLGPLAVEGNPWFGSAGEMVAFAYLEQGKQDQAGPLLIKIAEDENVPQGLRSRVRQLAGTLGFDAVTDIEGTIAEAQGDAPAAAQQ